MPALDVSAVIEERLTWLDPELEAALAAAPGAVELDLYRWARYHLGWLDGDLRPHSAEERRRHGGKRLRGVLTVLATEAAGGRGPDAAPAGAAIELIHNFSLVHDDVEDRDEERRHRPTVWKLWGVPHAINVGSNMQALVDAALLRLRSRHPAERVVAAFAEVNRAILRMTEGQFLDMSAEDVAGVSLDDYYRLIGGKTAALVEGAMRLGALLGSASPAQVDRLGDFGREFGLAFQCRDDYLGIWGDPARTGKPVGADLRRGKRSLPVVDVLEAVPPGTPMGDRLREALAIRDVPAVMDVMEAAGTPVRVREHVAVHTRRAREALDAADPREPFGDAIRGIAEFALSREN